MDDTKTEYLLLTAAVGFFIAFFLPVYNIALHFCERRGWELSLVSHAKVFGISIIATIVVLAVLFVVLTLVGWLIYAIFWVGSFVVTLFRRSK